MIIGGVVGGRLKKKEIYVCLKLIHLVVQQKIKHCKATRASPVKKKIFMAPKTMVFFLYQMFFLLTEPYCQGFLFPFKKYFWQVRSDLMELTCLNKWMQIKSRDAG